MTTAHSTAMKLPPANLEAEQALLGAILANNKAYERVAEFLRPEHFADPGHARVYAVAREWIEAGRVADGVSLRAYFEHTGEFEDQGGGATYLIKLVRAMTGILNAGEYGRVIHDTWLRRQVIDVGEQLVNRCYGGTETPQDGRQILAWGDEALLALATENEAKGGPRDGHQVAGIMMQHVARAIERKGALPGLTYGLAGLDRLTGGMRPAQFILLAGRPSMGKTSLGLKVAIGAAEAGARVLFVTAEMMAEDIMARAAVARAGLPLRAYTHGSNEVNGQLLPLTEEERNRLGAAARELGQLPILWDDESVTIPMIRARARGMQRRRRDAGGGLDLIIIDYLGRLRASERSAGFGLNSAVTELSAGLKDMAKALGVPLICLAQLSREVERREDKTPLLSDLRDSGSLEQDADLVGFIYREHYYLVRAEPKKGPREKGEDFEARLEEWRNRLVRTAGRAQVIVAKHRQGPTGPVRLRFNDRSAEFSDETEGDG